MPAGRPERLLILETSGRRGAVGLAEGDRLAARLALDEGRRHARDLAPAVQALLAGQARAARDLHAVVVSRGPGSYTGLRVGLMSARTLAYATGCALIGIDTFAVVADQAPAECRRLDVLADAQQDRVYVQSFQRGAAGWQPTDLLRIVRFSDWLATRPADVPVSGPGLARWGGQLPADVPRLAEELREPGLDSLHRLGLARFRADERDDPFTLEPLYLRPSSAEEQWDARERGSPLPGGAP